MSQATTWGVQSAGPATMAQYAVRDNAALDALLSAHRGSSRPSYAVASTIWVKAGTAPVTDAEIYYYDGTNDILIATINESTNAITFAGLEIGTDVQAYDADTMKSDTAARITANMGFTPVSDASSSGAVTFDFASGNVATITLTENITSITLSGATSGDTLKIIVTQAAGLYTVTGWPVAVKWPGDTEPVITATDAAVDIITLELIGSTYFGAYVQDLR